MNLQKFMLSAGKFLSVLIVGLLGAVCTAQEPEKIGPAFHVNTHIDRNQTRPSVAGLSGGGFVAVWQSDRQDGSLSGIYSQIFDSSGARVGSEFRVNTNTTYSQRDPSVAALYGGGFVVVWESEETSAGSENIYGQIFDISGAKAGSEFQVNTYTTSNWRADPSVAAFSDGGFVVVWESYGQDGSSYGIYGQMFNGSGDRVGSEFQVNTDTNQGQEGPSVAVLADGGFVVAWDSPGDGYWDGIYGQVFNGSGDRVGSEFQVNTYTDRDQARPSVAALSDGGFVVTWESSGQDTSEWGVFGQMFDSSGSRVGNEFQVNTHTTDGQQGPSVATFSDGGFVVTWASGDYPDNFGIYGQLFDYSGNKTGGEFEAYYLPYQRMQAVAALSGGGFVMITDAAFDDGEDVNNAGIFGQLYAIREPDSDGDGMPDWWEDEYFGNLDRDGSGDWDNDGLSDLEEFESSTNPTNADTDNDGISDSQDAFPTDPTEWLDTDGDGVGDNADLDDDGDGVPDVGDDYPLGRFDDARPGYWAFSFIEALARAGITAGCGNNNYCPDAPVTRAQMAVFLERGMNGRNFSPPAATGNVFLDVGAGDFAANFIERLLLDGITSGCGNGNYCPNATVTRAQMAVFLLRAKYGAGYSPPAASGVFGDVDLSYWAVHWIEQLAAEGISSGCGSGNYCPNDPVTRAQMAVFLVRTFDL